VNKDAAASSDHAAKSDEAMNKLLNQVSWICIYLFFFHRI
jgi:La-related protein 7